MTADERKSERDVTGISVLRNGHVRVEMCGNRWEEWDIAKLSEFSIKLIRELTAANEQIKRVREETIELTDDQWIDAQEIYEKAHGPTHGHAEWIDGIEAVLAYIRALKC